MFHMARNVPAFGIGSPMHDERKTKTMAELWLTLADLPEQGRKIHVAEQAVWKDPLHEFTIQASISIPLTARLFLLPGPKGLLIRGDIRGRIQMPCDRCTRDVRIPLDAAFELFEAYSPEEQNGLGTEGLIRFNQGKPELNAGELLWEQFLLALPIKPLCSKTCRGLCPKCGQNLNEGACSCTAEGSDPRMAVFRNLKIES